MLGAPIDFMVQELRVPCTTSLPLSHGRQHSLLTPMKGSHCGAAAPFFFLGIRDIITMPSLKSLTRQSQYEQHTNGDNVQGQNNVTSREENLMEPEVTTLW